MNVAARVKLAFLGSREERSLLIRDPSKVVWRAVLSSPKLTENEVEGFASQKIPSGDSAAGFQNRKFIKNYIVLKNLVNNPRLPIDIALPLLNRLMAMICAPFRPAKTCLTLPARSLRSRFLWARQGAGDAGRVVCDSRSEGSEVRAAVVKRAVALSRAAERELPARHVVNRLVNQKAILRCSLPGL